MAIGSVKLVRRTWRLILGLVRSVRTGLCMRRALRNGPVWSEGVIGSCRAAWGSPAGSGDVAFMKRALELARGVEAGTVLECGSGLSTVLLGAVVGEGCRVVSLEEKRYWAWRVKVSASVAGLRRADVRVCPISAHGEEGSWYDVSAAGRDIREVGLVVCDGPAATQDPLARHGLMPTLGSRMGADCLIILDDVNRQGEREVVRLWQEEYGVEILEWAAGGNGDQGYAVLSAGWRGRGDETEKGVGKAV